MSKQTKIYTLLTAALFVLFLGNIILGAVKIPISSILDLLLGDEIKPSWEFIILDSRLPQAITALFAGAALSVSGLLLQTLFRNPLADPSILGVSNGASLGVAIIMLYLGGGISSIGMFGTYLSIIISALLGAFLILSIIIYFSRKIRSNIMLLIIGIMVGYLSSSIISFLNFYAAPDKVHQYLMWGMGNFSSVSMGTLPYFMGFLILGLLLSILLIKPLNALLLGEQYAANLGVKVKTVRILILFCAGLLTAVITAFCGPISFIGLAVPHIGRLLLGNSNHKSLLPVSMLAGSCISLICNLITVLPGGIMMPLNAVTPIIGAPVIIYVIMNRKNIQYFN